MLKIFIKDLFLQCRHVKNRDKYLLCQLPVFSQNIPHNKKPTLSPVPQNSVLFHPFVRMLTQAYYTSKSG